MGKRTAVRLPMQARTVSDASNAREARSRSDFNSTKKPHPRLPATADEDAYLALKVAEEADQDDEGDRHAQQQQYN
jgi:hypothetical protein